MGQWRELRIEEVNVGGAVEMYLALTFLWSRYGLSSSLFLLPSVNEKNNLDSSRQGLIFKFPQLCLLLPTSSSKYIGKKFLLPFRFG